MTLADYLRFAGALLIVLGLILGAAWLYRRLAGTGGGRPWLGGRTRRLSVAESLPLDASRRLMLVRRDGTEHLIVVGQDRVTVVETGIPAPSTDAFPATGRPNGSPRSERATGEKPSLRAVETAAPVPDAVAPVGAQPGSTPARPDGSPA